MIAKKYRLREYEIRRVFKKGRLYFGKYWNMNVLGSKSDHHRIAISITRKHSKKAVLRNRCRRVSYDALFPHILQQNMSGYMCIFTLKKGLQIVDRNIPDFWTEDAKCLVQKLGKSEKSLQ